MGKRHSHLCAAVFFHTVIAAFALALWSPTVVAVDPPTPVWRSTGCAPDFNVCANVTTPESWSDGGRDIYFFLNALMADNSSHNVNVTVWYVGENFNHNWAHALQNNHFNVVQFSPRGSELAYPQIRCNPEYYNNNNHCWPNASCAEEIARSGLNMTHFSIEETANDLAWVLQTLGSGVQNVVVTEGISTFVVQRMLQLYAKMDDVSVIMAGFTHPEHFDIFGSIGSYDVALQRLLTYCDEDSEVQCAFLVGALEGMWNRFVNVMEAAEQGTLYCNNRLQWGVQPEKMHREYRAIVAALLKKPQHFLLQSSFSAVELIPSFIYRLQRCSDRDIESLTRLRNFVISAPRDLCPSFIPQRYNWLVNELTLAPPSATPEELILETSKVRQVMPNVTVLQALYEVYKAFPKYTVANKGISRTLTPMLLLYSNLDPVFPFDTAALAGSVYQSPSRILPHQFGFPVSTSASYCIQKNLEAFRTTLRWAPASSCSLQSSDQLDFIYVNAHEIYGVSDAWEFTVPNPPESLSNSSMPSTTEEPINPDHNKICSKRAENVLAVFLVGALVAIAILLYLYWKTKGSPAFSDDFYKRLRH